MQLISCTHCRQTWIHREEENPSRKEDAPRISISSRNQTPCFHHYDVETSTFAMKSVFEAIPYIPTLTDSIDVEFVAMFLQYGSIGEKGLSIAYQDVNEDLIDYTPDGSGSYLRETVSYQGQEVNHLAYFEREGEFYTFTISDLKLLFYLYKKDPIGFAEKITAWHTQHDPLTDFHKGLEEFEAEHGPFV